MKVVIVGGYGLIGTKLVERLRFSGYDVSAVSRRSGVDAMTGRGLEEAFVGAHTVVDVTNSPSFEDPDVLKFFDQTTVKMLEHEALAGVAHHIALSVVGTDRLQTSAYFRAKLVQETLIAAFSPSYTILRATQFFEFMASIIPPGTLHQGVYLPAALVRPTAADDVADLMAEIVDSPPANQALELSGPEKFRLCDLVQWVMYFRQDERPVIADPGTHYYGALINDCSLTPQGASTKGATHFRDWLQSYLPNIAALPHVHAPNPL